MVVTWVDIFLVNTLEGILYTNILYKGSDGNLEFHKQDSISVQCVRDDSKRSRLVTVDAVISYFGRSVLQTPQPMVINTLGSGVFFRDQWANFSLPYQALYKDRWGRSRWMNL